MSALFRSQFFVAGFIALIAVMPLTTASASVPAAEKFIQGATDEIIDILTTAKSRSERETRFEKLLNDKADLRRMGRFILGQFVRQVSKEDFETYQALLETMMIKVYSNRLNVYSNEKIIIKGSQQKKRNVIVESEITFTNGRAPITLDWWLIQQKQGGYKLFDLRILGIWVAQEQRATFSSVLKNNKGDFQTLIDHLQKQVEFGLAKNAQNQASGN